MRSVARFVLWPGGQPDTDRGGPADVDGRGAAVRLDDRTDDGQTDTGAAAVARRVVATEAVEGSRREGGGEPWALVAHLDLCPAVVIERGHEGDVAGVNASNDLVT